MSLPKMTMGVRPKRRRSRFVGRPQRMGYKSGLRRYRGGRTRSPKRRR